MKNKHILILYFSKSGNTQLIANFFHNKLHQINSDAGKGLKIEVLSVENFDNHIITAVKNADVLIFGSPDYFGYVSGYIKAIFDTIYDFRSEMRDRVALGFISHGGGGQASVSLKNLIQWNKMTLFHPVFLIKGSFIDPTLDQEITAVCQNLFNSL